ncbi:flagellin [Halosimplex sp. TS25]|uniref:flagellin n=1 Tax=Halosimplex rarum TaxID=3396619 RepID=UPI0039EB991A
MGFSVSGSAALIFIGLFIAFGMWQTAASNSFERVTEAQNDRADAALERTNTAIDIRTSSYTTKDHNNRTWYLIDLAVRNTGSNGLSVERTDILLDNEYMDGWETEATVDGDAATDLWLPHERLFVEFNESTEPSHVKVATETGVSGSAEVSVS